MNTLTLKAALFITFCSYAHAGEMKIVDMPDAPLEISGVTASYLEEGSYNREGIRIQASVRNHSEKRVAAYSIVFITFDVFNEILGRPFEGFAMDGLDANDSDVAVWQSRPLSSFRFGDSGSIVSYVAKARMDDGTIWKADENIALDAVREFEASLTIEDIQPE